MLTALCLMVAWAWCATALAAEWALVHTETFDGTRQLRDKVPFGDKGWLTPGCGGAAP